MSSDVLLEEFEVLESIYPSELTKISDTVIQLDVEPEDYDSADGGEQLKITLEVQYPPQYPDVLPELSLHTIEGEGEIEDSEINDLLNDLRAVGEENLGIAMTFTLVSHLREQLSVLVKTRSERRRKEEMEKERLAIEVFLYIAAFGTGTTLLPRQRKRERVERPSLQSRLELGKLNSTKN